MNKEITNCSKEEPINEYKLGLIKSINITISMTQGNDNYYIGVRNGLKICKAFIDGKTPEYE